MRFSGLAGKKVLGLDAKKVGKKERCRNTSDWITAVSSWLCDK